MLLLLITILSLIITCGISVCSIIKRKKLKEHPYGLIFLIILGFLVAVFLAYLQDKEKKEAVDKLAMANRHLEDMTKMLEFVRLTVGDLAKLNAISGGSKYYIRIATDTNKERLHPYLKRINTIFKGAEQSGLVAIRKSRSSSRNYELVFGQGLEMAAAEVFYRLATMHKFPPPNQIPAILPDLSQ